LSINYKFINQKGVKKIGSKLLKIRVTLVKRNEPNILRHELTTVVQHL